MESRLHLWKYFVKRYFKRQKCWFKSFLFSIIFCSCSWCGINEESKILEFLLLNKFILRLQLALHNFYVHFRVKFDLGSLWNSPLVVSLLKHESSRKRNILISYELVHKFEYGILNTVLKIVIMNIFVNSILCHNSEIGTVGFLPQLLGWLSSVPGAPVVLWSVIYTCPIVCLMFSYLFSLTLWPN